MSDLYNYHNMEGFDCPLDVSGCRLFVVFVCPSEQISMTLVYPLVRL